MSTMLFVMSFVRSKYIFCRKNPLALAVIALSFVAVAMMPEGYGAADVKILVGLAGLWPETVPASLLAMLVFDLYWRKVRPGKLAPLVVAIYFGVMVTMVGEAWGGGG